MDGNQAGEKERNEINLGCFGFLFPMPLPLEWEGHDIGFVIAQFCLVHFNPPTAAAAAAAASLRPAQPTRPRNPCLRS